jgi:hypothetical protein
LESKFHLDDGASRYGAAPMVERRAEERTPVTSGTAVLEFRGRRRLVRVVNVSDSGAMVIFPDAADVGERLSIQLLDRGVVSAQVRWVKDGRIGLTFGSRRTDPEG